MSTLVAQHELDGVLKDVVYEHHVATIYGDF